MIELTSTFEGSLSENIDVKAKLVELGSIATVVKHLYLGQLIRNNTIVNASAIVLML
jgi:hypothetical protein